MKICQTYKDYRQYTVCSAVSNEGFTLKNSDSETKTVLRTKIKKAAALPFGL